MSRLEDSLGQLAISSDSDKEFIPEISQVISIPSSNPYLSARAVATVLEPNHVKYHCFFNEQRHHNHIVHHVLALYSLGAIPEVIKLAFDRESPLQKPIQIVKDYKIDSSNWTLHLGDHNYYGNYLKFFKDEVQLKSAKDAIEEYIFNNPNAEMLHRSFSGLLHPIIHWGYGLEFKSDAIVAEGLAITAVHTFETQALNLSALLTEVLSESNSDNHLSKNQETLDLTWSDSKLYSSNNPFKPKSGLTGFEILAKISQDQALSSEKLGLNFNERSLLKASKSKQLAHWCQQWKIEANPDRTELFQRTQELIWLVTVIYATTYDDQRKVYQLSFALMHLVTSVLFLPSILPSLSPRFRPIVLTAFFRVALNVWVGSGRPRLNLSEFVQDSANLKLPESQNLGEGENPWYKILLTAAKHPDEHTTKIIRTFAFASKAYGSTPKGYYRSELKGTEELDSTVFLRASIMTLNKLDWDAKTSSRPLKWFS